MEKNEIMAEDDFGFTLVSEEEVKANEAAAASALEQSKLQVIELSDRLKNSLAVIQPLLKALKANPDKQYIFWPDRVAKIDALTKKLATTAYPPVE